MINRDLYIDFNTKLINDEFLYYLNTPGKFGTISKRNEIIKFFQQNTFYKHEKDLWNSSDEIKQKIILNRIKYLNKDIDELTSIDILTGFKRAGMYYGFSHFNPLWFKWFIEKYKISSCYDPCGGWGHRLLGGLSLKKYIYNDLSITTKENVDNIINFFGIQNTETYSNDARKFIPDFDFEAMFTCPPYFNIEHYECGDFKNMEEYNNFIDCLFNTFINKQSCKIFGIIIREDLLDIKKYVPNETYLLQKYKSQHITKNKQFYEKLYFYFK